MTADLAIELFVIGVTTYVVIRLLRIMVGRVAGRLRARRRGR